MPPTLDNIQCREEPYILQTRPPPTRSSNTCLNPIVLFIHPFTEMYVYIFYWDVCIQHLYTIKCFSTSFYWDALWYPVCGPPSLLQWSINPTLLCCWWSFAGRHWRKPGFSFCNMHDLVGISVTGKFCYVVDFDLFSLFSACVCLEPQNA